MDRASGIRKWIGSLINPEKLWMHYTAALIITIGLLVSIHFVSVFMVRQSETAQKTMDISADQTVLGQRVLLKATLLAAEPDPDFTELTELIRVFETRHLFMLQGDIWSDRLQQHYFGGPAPLNAQIRQFSDFANRLTLFPASERPRLVAEMQTLFDEQGMYEALKASGALFAEVSTAETLRLQHLQEYVIAASIFVLMLEAVLIFWPAQAVVRQAISELREKTVYLSQSQAQLQEMNGTLQHMVAHDALTGLPNRSFMGSFLTEMFETQKAGELGVALLSLDGFKSINDSIGHEQGDLLLIEVGRRLSTCIDEGDIVARIGGDEFFLTTTEPPDILAKRALATLEEPFLVGERPIKISCSIGHVNVDLASGDPDQTLSDANIALQSAKSAGGKRVASFSAALRNEVIEMQRLQMELAEAIGNGQLEPWFQPQINLRDGTLRGVEVLARWRHPIHGILTPDKFLPVAERAGLTIELDYAIWQAAIDTAQVWQEAGQWRPCISLNASPDTISEPHLIERLLKQIHDAALEPDQVIVEVLESTVIESADDMAAINIDSIAECGLGLELDDFGTGYASLAKLTQLPLAGIKLDRSLITPLPDSGADSVVRAILALATELGLQVVAEGIEEVAVARHLNGYGCGIGQGYGFARPMGAGEFAEWLATHGSQPVDVGLDAEPLSLRA